MQTRNLTWFKFHFLERVLCPRERPLWLSPRGLWASRTWQVPLCFQDGCRIAGMLISAATLTLLHGKLGSVSPPFESGQSCSIECSGSDTGGTSEKIEFNWKNRGSTAHPWDTHLPSRKLPHKKSEPTLRPPYGEEAQATRRAPSTPKVLANCQ